MSTGEEIRETLFLWDNNGIRITLINHSTGQSFAFDLQDRFVVGRSRENADLQITTDDRYISGRHLLFTRQQEGVFAEDLQTRNGTRINGKKILSPTRICSGDIIRMGRSEFEVML